MDNYGNIVCFFQGTTGVLGSTAHVAMARIGVYGLDTSGRQCGVERILILLASSVKGLSDVLTFPATMAGVWANLPICQWVQTPVP